MKFPTRTSGARSLRSSYARVSHELLVKCLLRLGRVEEALDAAERAVALGSDPAQLALPVAWVKQERRAR